jgi:kanamycin kinase
MVAGPPPTDVQVPARVVAVAAGRPVRPVWENELGGLTFEVGGRCFVKWAPAGSGLDLAREAARLAWAVEYVAVPRVLDQGADDDGAWLVTAALPGRSAVDPRWRAEPRTAVVAIGEGLRALHETLPVAGCPFSWAAEDRVADARRRAAEGLIGAVLEMVGDVPPPDRTVVCHGDACAPNTLLAEDGRWSGHVDLGALGVADRWADLAVATWSTEWNYGPGWERPLLDAYGIRPDPERSRYYRLLWDLGP